MGNLNPEGNIENKETADLMEMAKDAADGYLNGEPLKDYTLEEALAMLEPGTKGIFRINGVDCIISIPENVESSTGIVEIGRGSGSIGGIGRSFEYAEENNSNAILIAPIHGSHSDFAGSIEIMDALIDKYGLTESTPVISGFSGSCDGTMEAAVNFVEKNPGKQLIIVQFDPSELVGQEISDDEVKLLIENGTKLILFEQPNHKDSFQHYAELGLDITKVSVKISNGPFNEPYNSLHGQIFALGQESGFIDMSTGEYDFSKLPTGLNYDFNGVNIYYEFEYNFEYYDQNLQKWVTFETIEMANASIPGASSTVEIIESDDEFLASELNAIRNVISGMVNINSNLNVQSTTQVPSQEPGMISSIITSSQMLIEKINNELSSIAAVGSAFAEMDNFLAKESTKLGLDLVSKPIPEVPLNNTKSSKTEYGLNEEATDRYDGIQETIKNNKEENYENEPTEEEKSQPTPNDNTPSYSAPSGNRPQESKPETIPNNNKTNDKEEIKNTSSIEKDETKNQNQSITTKPVEENKEIEKTENTTTETNPNDNIPEEQPQKPVDTPIIPGKDETIQTTPISPQKPNVLPKENNNEKIITGIGLAGAIGGLAGLTAYGVKTYNNSKTEKTEEPSLKINVDNPKKTDDDENSFGV